MGVYIKGMEMPENCTFCEMWYNIDCHPYQGISPPKSRPDHCPLVEVPKHGRLIDADKMKEKWSHKNLDLFGQGWGFLHDLNQAKTVIPASDEET